MRRVYQPTVAALVLLLGGGTTLILICLFLIAVASFADGSTDERIGTVVFALLLGSLGVFMLFLYRVRLVADDAGVEVLDYLTRRPFTWNEIDRLEVGFASFGISLVPRSGSPLKVNAIQKTNLYHWLGKRGRADRISDELNGLLADRRAPLVPPLPPPD
jgi:hypothetical protein